MSSSGAILTKRSKAALRFAESSVLCVPKLVLETNGLRDIARRSSEDSKVAYNYATMRNVYLLSAETMSMLANCGRQD